MTNTDDLRAMIAFADATGRSVKVPAGTFNFDYPFRLPKSGVMRGCGRKSTKFVPTAYTPAFLSVGPEHDTAPIDGNGCHPDGIGWTSLSDYWSPSPTTQLCVEIDFTLMSLPADERVLLSGRGQLDDVADDRPFFLSVVGDRLKLKSGAVSWESPVATVATGRTRVVAQHSSDRVSLWVVSGGVPTLLFDSPAPPLSWPAHCQMTLGISVARFPEGSADMAAPSGITIRCVSVCSLCPYSVTDPNLPPPSGQAVPNNALGVWTDFSSPDGCLFRGSVSGQPAVMIWRATVSDAPEVPYDFGDLSIDGQAKCPVAFWSAAGRESLLSNMDIVNCHYGVMIHSQGYNSVLERIHATTNYLGIALCNNSSIINVNACHGGEANTFGLVAADAPSLNVSGGWYANNKTNLVVKGDSADLVVSGSGFGFEGAVGSANVLLSNCSSAVLSGTKFYMGSNRFPAVSMLNCSGGKFWDAVLSLPTGSDGAIKTVNHDANRPVEYTEGRRFGGSQTAPFLCPGNT